MADARTSTETDSMSTTDTKKSRRGQVANRRA